MNKNSEFIKLIRTFLIIPSAGWLIDRPSNFQKVKVHKDLDSVKMIVSFIQKAKNFKEHRLASGVQYILAGVLPMVNKYVISIYNLIDYKDRKHIESGMSHINLIVTCMKENNELLCEICSIKDEYEINPKTLQWSENVYEEYISQQSSGSIINKSNDDLDCLKYEDVKIVAADKLRSMCECILYNFDTLYGGYPDYQPLVNRYKCLTEKEFHKRFDKTRFQEDYMNEMEQDRLRVTN